MQSTIATFDNTPEGCERSLYAFLAEKECWDAVNLTRASHVKSYVLRPRNRH
jgi:hypothetical protein